MIDPRREIFDAVRTAAPPGVFNDPGNILALNNLLDALGVPREPERSTGFKLGPKGIALIQKWEGYANDLGDGRVQAYPDPASGGVPWTIGWGSTGPDITKGTIWTREKAQHRFLAHVDEFSAGVTRNVGNAPTTQAQHDAMCSLAYNVGLANFAGSTLLKKHKAGDYAGAADEFARWNRAAGKVMTGLTNRRADEAKLYRGDS